MDCKTFGFKTQTVPGEPGSLITPGYCALDVTHALLLKIKIRVIFKKIKSILKIPIAFNCFKPQYFKYFKFLSNVKGEHKIFMVS